MDTHWRKGDPCMLHLDSGDNQRNSEGSPTKRLACRPGIVIILLSALFSFGGPLLAQNKQDDYSKAGKLFAEGANLFGKGSEASLRKAIEKFEEALALFRVLNDRADQARTLIALAQIYNILGDKQRFLDYSSQALPLNRAAGDREAEAVTLNDIGVAYSYLGEQQKALETYKQAL